MKKKQLISKEVLIGFFTLSVLIGSYLGYNYLKNRKIFSNDYFIYAVFDNAGGLETGAGVVTQGFKIGTVEAVDFQIEQKNLIVKMLIDGKYDVPANSIAEIASASLLGGKAVNIQLGTDLKKSLTSGDTITSSNAMELMDLATSEYEVLRGNLSEIVDKLNGALDGINRTLSQQNTESLSKTLAHIESTTASLDRIAQSQRSNIESTLKNLEKLSASLGNSAPELERSISNIATISDELKNSAPSLIENADNSLKSLEAILEKVNNGEGTAGQLINDQEMYNNLNTAIENLSLLLSDLKENPGRYVHVSVFGGGKK